MQITPSCAYILLAFPINAQFVSALTFSGKLLIFQRAFSRKLSQFPVFGNDFENEFENVF